MRTVIEEDATQKRRGVNAPKVFADKRDQGLIDQYENKRAQRPEVYDKIVSGALFSPSRVAAGASHTNSSQQSPILSRQGTMGKGSSEPEASGS